MLKEGCRPTAGGAPVLCDSRLRLALWRRCGARREHGRPLGGASRCGFWGARNHAFYGVLGLWSARNSRFGAFLRFARALERWCGRDRPLGRAPGSGFRGAYPCGAALVCARQATGESLQEWFPTRLPMRWRVRVRATGRWGEPRGVVSEAPTLPFVTTWPKMAPTEPPRWANMAPKLRGLGAVLARHH